MLFCRAKADGGIPGGLGGAANGILVIDGGFIQIIAPDIKWDRGVGRGNPLAQISAEIPMLEWAGICGN